MSRQFDWREVLESDDPDHHKDGSPHEPDWSTLTIAQDYNPNWDFPWVILDVHCDLCGLSGSLSMEIAPQIGSEEAIHWV